MYIRKMFAQKPCVFSAEVFPPKQVLNWENLQQTLRAMKPLNLDFISVTFSAGGSGTGGVTTRQVASFLKNDLDIEPLAHLTCATNTRATVEETLDGLFTAGVRNIMALRGDRNPDVPQCHDFEHASDLAVHIRRHYGAFGISGACYPEKHPEAATLQEDVDNLKRKEENGAAHLASQLFFDNSKFYRFTNLARKQGVDLPISAGVMPIVRKSQIERTVALSDASLPPAFTAMLEKWQDDEDGLYKAGIDYAIGQFRDLIEAGADGVHLYCMNNADVACKVFQGVADLR